RRSLAQDRARTRYADARQGPRLETLVDDGLRLLAHELCYVVHGESYFAGRAAALPAAECLDARPRAGRRTGSSVDVEHACLDPVHELLDLALVLAVDAGGE